MNAPQSLAELVDLAMVNRGVKSGRRLAELAQQRGHRITNTTVNAIRSGTYKFRPTDETVRAIGWLAGVTDEVAFAAAGLRVPGPPFADELPPGVDTLSRRKRKAVIELLRVLIEDEEVMGNAEHPAPTSTTQHATGSGKSHAIATADDELDDYDESSPPPPEARALAVAVPPGEYQPEEPDEPLSVASADDYGGPDPKAVERSRQAELERRRKAARERTPAPPAGLAARDVGKPSRGEQLREDQDRDAEGEGR